MWTYLFRPAILLVVVAASSSCVGPREEPDPDESQISDYTYVEPDYKKAELFDWAIQHDADTAWWNFFPSVLAEVAGRFPTFQYELEERLVAEEPKLIPSLLVDDISKDGNDYIASFTEPSERLFIRLIGGIRDYLDTPDNIGSYRLRCNEEQLAPIFDTRRKISGDRAWSLEMIFDVVAFIDSVEPMAFPALPEDSFQRQSTAVAFGRCVALRKSLAREDYLNLLRETP
jgi:hypothetical protein